VLTPEEVVKEIIDEQIEYIPDFQTKKVVDLSPEEEEELIIAMDESIKYKSKASIILNGQIFVGQDEDGVVRFCIKKCLYPSFANTDNSLYINGSVDYPEGIREKLDEANAVGNAMVDIDGVVRIVRLENNGQWKIKVPLSEIPEGNVEAKIQTSANGSDSQDITIARLQSAPESSMSRTSIVIFVNLGLAVLALAIFIIRYIIIRQQPLTKA